MADYNKVLLMGKLSDDVELRYINGDRAVADITLLVDSTFKGKTTTAKVPVTLWASNAQMANDYLSKGSEVFIEGTVKENNWERDGKQYSKLQITASRVEAISGKQQHSAPAEPAYSASSPPPVQGDDIF
jgi:single-strand DNA-binding protein|tara:strand:+ start:3918 stop:4307 length:390 start_codon:yes stop_codon:yes gene_type:complete